MSLKRELEADLEEEKPVKKLKPEDVVKKHSLDSDEEDSGDEGHKRYEILEDDDIEGQEDGVSGQDGEVKITPFNMKEELEEGHFDTDGNFHWNKDNGIKDSWLDNIDWMQIKDTPGTKAAMDDTMDSTASDSPFDLKAAYKQVLEHMQPGETVTRSLKRLGGSGSLSASERLKRKKAGLPCDVGDTSKVTELTELANRILTKTGNMNVYQETYSHISSIVHSRAGTSKSTDYGDALDMYADDFDEKEKERISHKTEDEVKDAEPSLDETLMWEYKLDKNAATIQGPHTTEQMQKYVSEGFFTTEIFVRKVGQDGGFYSSKRVDFELYL